MYGFVKRNLVKIILYTVELFVIILCGFPIVWVMLSSFKSNAEILEGPFTLPSSIQVGIDAYTYILEKYDFITTFSNSLIVSVVSVMISMIVLSMAAYVLAKYRFPGDRLLYILLTITMLVPNHAKAQPIYTMVTKMGLGNSRAGLILIYIGGGIAMSLFIMRANFYAIPKEIDEAAFIDGASFLTVFTRINLPLAKSGIVTAAVMMFLSNWNEYFYASLINTKEQYRTLPVLFKYFDQRLNFNYGRMFAAMTLAILPSIIIYALAQEQIQESMASTGVKG